MKRRSHQEKGLGIQRRMDDNRRLFYTELVAVNPYLRNGGDKRPGLGSNHLDCLFRSTLLWMRYQSLNGGFGDDLALDKDRGKYASVRSAVCRIGIDHVGGNPRKVTLLNR